MQKSDVLKQIDAAIAAWATLAYDDDFPSNPYHENTEDRGLEVATTIAETIRRFAPPGSEYRERLNKTRLIMPSNDGLAMHLDLIGTLRSLRTAYANDYLATVVELVHADTFADLLDQATYLLEQNYKDAAAVIAGGVLEGHIRQLCDKYGVPTIDAKGKPEKASVLNDQLKKSNAYGTLEHKSVLAWQDLRNKAAHGDYGSYQSLLVEAMLMGVRQFIATHPA